MPPVHWSWSHVEDAAKWVGVAGAIGGALVGAGKAVAGAYRAFRTRHETRAKRDAQLDLIVKQVGELVEQTRANGGSTLKDALARIEDSIGSVRLWQEALADEHPVPLWRDSGNGCTWVNRAYRRMVGRSLEELREHGYMLAVVPEQRDAVEAEFTAAVEQERSFEMDITYVTPEGRRTPCRVQGVRIGSLGYFGTATPVQRQPMITGEVAAP